MRIASGKRRDSIALEDLKKKNHSWLFGVIQLGRALSSVRVAVRRSWTASYASIAESSRLQAGEYVKITQ